MAPTVGLHDNIRNRVYKPEHGQSMVDRVRVQTELRQAVARRNQRDSKRSRVTPQFIEYAVDAEMIDL